MADAAGRHQLDAQHASMMSTIYELGFHPVGLHDLRSRGSDVVMIDFGSDLGAPRAQVA
jgi:hypothetical protein